MIKIFISVVLVGTVVFADTYEVQKIYSFDLLSVQKNECPSNLSISIDLADSNTPVSIFRKDKGTVFYQRFIRKNVLTGSNYLQAADWNINLTVVDERLHIQFLEPSFFFNKEVSIKNDSDNRISISVERTDNSSQFPVACEYNLLK